MRQSSATLKLDRSLLIAPFFMNKKVHLMASVDEKKKIMEGGRSEDATTRSTSPRKPRGAT